MSKRKTTRPSTLSRLAAGVPLLLIRIYQKTLSPLLPAIFGPSCSCRFYPTCSHYASEAIRTHGVLRGGLLSIIRLLKCTPLHPGGIDPVPPREKQEKRSVPCPCKHHSSQHH